MYYESSGVEQNYQKAFSCVQKVANQGYADAQFSLGIMYGSGVGINQDYEKAMQWYLLAANNG